MKARTLITAVAALAALVVPSTALASVTSSPSTVNFGTVPVDSVNVGKKITLTNSTADPISFGYPGAPSGGWVVLPDGQPFDTDGGGTCTNPQNGYFDNSVVIQPGDSCTTYVTFHPYGSDADTTYSADLYLYYYDEAIGSIQQVDIGLLAYTVSPVSVKSTSLSPSYIYPLVRDGYRDNAYYSFTLNQAASGSVQVRNSHGTVVKSFPFSGRSSMSVQWGGRNNSGNKVAPGYYHFRVVAHSNGMSITSASRTTQVKTGWKTVRHTKRRSGTNTTSRSGSSCHWHSDYGTLVLDSWGGFCSARWNIGVPSNAFNVSYGMAVSRDPDLDFFGPVSHSMTRTSGGVSFNAYAGSYAALDVSGVHVSYSTKVRI